MVSAVSERIAHMSFVGISGEQIDSTVAQSARIILETVARVEIEIVDLLWKALARLAMNIRKNVVIELIHVKHRNTRAANRCGCAGILHEHMENRQNAGAAATI